jgi:hypothetical protein
MCLRTHLRLTALALALLAMGVFQVRPALATPGRYFLIDQPCPGQPVGCVNWDYEVEYDPAPNGLSTGDLYLAQTNIPRTCVVQQGSSCLVEISDPAHADIPVAVGVNSGIIRTGNFGWGICLNCSTYPGRFVVWYDVFESTPSGLPWDDRNPQGILKLGAICLWYFGNSYCTFRQDIRVP